MGENGSAQPPRPRGRGPEYTWRVMPTVLPQVRAELKSSGTVTDWQLRHRYTQVAPGVVVPAAEGGHDPTAHGGFGADCVTRSWANHLIRPDAVLGGWGAAEVHGLRPDWGDSAPVLLLQGTWKSGSETTASAVRRPLRPVIRPLPDDLRVLRPEPRFPELKVVLPGLAAAQCLRTILTGRHRWWVHDVPGMSWTEVRAVQFLDAFAQCTWVTRDEVLSAAAGLVNRRVLATLLEMSDAGAQSPMETVMRLMVRDVLPTPYQWQSQIRVDLEPGAAEGWTRRTLPDLGCPALRIALYYDGAHHDAMHQTDVDFDQFHALRDLGWEVLRFNRKHLRDPGELRERVTAVIGRAVEAQASGQGRG